MCRKLLPSNVTEDNNKSGDRNGLERNSAVTSGYRFLCFTCRHVCQTIKLSFTNMNWIDENQQNRRSVVASASINDPGEDYRNSTSSNGFQRKSFKNLLSTPGPASELDDAQSPLLQRDRGQIVSYTAYVAKVRLSACSACFVLATEMLFAVVNILFCYLVVLT